MADLPEIQSAIAAKIVGANSTGDETYYLAVSSSGTLTIDEREPATFAASSIGTLIAFNKSMLAIQNASSVKVKIHKIQIVNVQTAAVTGAVGIFELKKFSSPTGGTAIPCIPFDTNKPIPAGVSASTGATIVTEGPTIKRWLWSTDEWGVGTLDQEGLDHAFQTNSYVYSSDGKTAPIVLNASEGIHIKQTGNIAAGSFDIYIEFTAE
jgi:hypothetical protein